MARKQRVLPGAHRTSIYLTTAQEHALVTIEHLRRHRKDGRDSPSEIVADAIWQLLETYGEEKRAEIEARFPEPLAEVHLKAKIAQMPKPKRKR